MDPPHGREHRNDRTVRAGPDPHRRRPVNKIVSYGTSSYGYDIRCAPEFKVFTNIYSTVVDPKNFDEKSFVDINADVCVIPPNSFALARTLEYFRIPRNVLTICLGKSTYARCGIIVNVTPFEPEWEGYVTLEFQQHHAVAGQDLCGRGLRPGAVLRERRGLRDQLQGPRRQVPGSARASPCPRPEVAAWTLLCSVVYTSTADPLPDEEQLERPAGRGPRP